MARVPLRRPEPLALEPRLAWPGPCVAIFGEAEGPHADALLAAWPGARRLEVVVRHAEGAAVSPERIEAHPTAVEGALRALLEGEPVDAPVVGVGLAFAAAVEADLLVHVGPVHALASLPPTARATVRRASLVLESPRLETMRELGARLAGA